MSTIDTTAVPALDGQPGVPAWPGSATGLPPGALTIIELRGATKEYPGTPPVRALDAVDLDVRAGEMVAIVGPSGSGKSTMLHLIGALDRPSAGIVRIAGHDVNRLSDRQLSALRARTIGFVFQRFHLLAGLSALDNVAVGLVYRGVPGKIRHERATRALARVGLSHRLRHRPNELSGGEQQRVAIARAIIGGPSVVLADEPTGNLDTATGAEVLDVFEHLHTAGTTVVLITHDPTVAAHAPRVVTLRDGHVESDNTRARAQIRAPR